MTNTAMTWTCLASRVLWWPSAQDTEKPPVAVGKSPLPGPQGLGPVVYVMGLNRRMEDNAALTTAMDLATVWGRPLLVVEMVSSTYPWASARHHTFMAQGAGPRVKNQPGYLLLALGADPSFNPNPKTYLSAQRSSGWEAFATTPTSQPTPGVAGGGALPAILEHASGVVVDWAPYFITPLLTRTLWHSTQGARGQLCLLVDDCGVVPLAHHRREESAARFFRPTVTAHLPHCLDEHLRIKLRIATFTQWAQELPGGQWDPMWVWGQLANRAHWDTPSFVAQCGVSTTIGPVELEGGEAPAHARLHTFVENLMAQYHTQRNHPDAHNTSGLSPYLHYGHIHPRSILAHVCHKGGVEGPHLLTAGEGPAVFCDELLVWRELGLNMAHFALAKGKALGDISLLPPWAHKTLEEHGGKDVLPFEDLEEARTPDPLWNATQRELMASGSIHNYMRMLWGKGIVRWSASPSQALERMECLNNAYGLDGRDPNSYTGFYWCLGKFDRPWPPARPPFGMVRSMSSQAARKKLILEEYLQRWGNGESGAPKKPNRLF